MDRRAHARRLERIYQQIPTFECVPGCTDCCGPVPTTPLEAERAPKLDGVLTRMTFGCLDCPYEIDGKGCAAYENRPFMCRLFGATEDPRLRCPHGRGPKKPLSMRKTDELTKLYLELVDEV